MGEANQRGTFDERREEALWRDADMVIWLRDEGPDKGLHFGAMPQRDDLREDNMAMIFAGFLNANFADLVRMARVAYERSKTAIPQAHKPEVITEVTPRIIGADGPATAGVRLVGVDGKPVN